MARQHQFPRVFSDHSHKAIGILGGSFNPAHDGHAHIADMAAQALGLDEIWWLVSPQNPLKSSADMASFEDRFNSALAVASRCKAASIMRISALELRLDLTVTYKTLTQLRQRMRSAHLVWIMGGDNLLSFHRWARPEMIARSMSIAVVNRPGSRHLQLSRGKNCRHKAFTKAITQAWLSPISLVLYPRPAEQSVCHKDQISTLCLILRERGFSLIQTFHL